MRRNLGNCMAAAFILASMTGFAAAQASAYRLAERRDFAPGAAIEAEGMPGAKDLARMDGGVALSKEHSVLAFDIPVPAPGRTVAVIVRCRATQGNVFNWIEFESGGRSIGRVFPCIDKYVNIKFLVENPEGASMAVTATLREGDGCVIDYVRPYEAAAAYAIPALCAADAKPVKAPEKAFAPTAEFRMAAVTSARWMFGKEAGVPMSGTRGMIKRTNAWSPDAESWKMTFGRVISLFETPDLPNESPSEISFEARHPMLFWDEFESRDDLSDAWRLETVNTLFLLARTSFVDWAAYNVARYYREASGRYPEDGKMVNFGRNPYRFQSEKEILPALTQARRYNEKHPWIAHNHMLWPALSLHVASGYFSRYGRPEAAIWAECARYTEEPMLEYSKPMEDCSGYQIHAMNLVIEYAADQKREAFFGKDGPLYRFFDLVICSTNNTADSPGYGDVGGYAPRSLVNGAEGDVFDAVLRVQTVAPEAFRKTLTEGKRREDYMGVYVCPLEPRFYKWYMDQRPEADIPGDQRFDKITFRRSFDRNDQYLMLDGISFGYHGHIDGNTILDFSDEGRIWLTERGYDNRFVNLALADQHGGVTVSRPDVEKGADSPRDSIPVFTALLEKREDGDSAMTHTVTRNCNGADWSRRIFWRKEQYFVVVDELTARREGPVRLTCRWRTLGEPSLDGRRFRAVQKPNSGVQVEDKRSLSLVLVNCDDSNLTMAKGKESPGLWSKYPYAGSQVHVLEEGWEGAMRSGESRRFVNVFGVVDTGKEGELEAKVMSDGAVVVSFAGEARSWK